MVRLYFVLSFGFFSLTNAFAQPEGCAKLVAYYAHPISIYGRPQEARDIETIRQLGFDVLNPNTPEHDAGYKAAAANNGDGMAYFVELIRTKTHLVVFRAFADGSIPAGVAKEIQVMRDMKGPIIELPTAIGRRTLTVEATREFLREGGTR